MISSPLYHMTFGTSFVMVHSNLACFFSGTVTSFSGTTKSIGISGSGRTQSQRVNETTDTDTGTGATMGPQHRPVLGPVGNWPLHRFNTRHVQRTVARVHPERSQHFASPTFGCCNLFPKWFKFIFFLKILHTPAHNHSVGKKKDCFCCFFKVCLQIY